MFHHRQYTVPLCLGVRDPGIAELRSMRSRVVCETISSIYLSIGQPEMIVSVHKLRVQLHRAVEPCTDGPQGSYL